MPMSTGLSRELMRFGSTLPIALLVWIYYRRRTFALAERYSTFAPRFWTGFVDSCVLWPITFSTSAILALDVPPGVAAVLVVVESLAWLLYTVVMHGRYGQTVGKMATKVRVVDFRTEGKISFGQAWLREGIPMFLALGLLGYQVSAILTGSVSPSDIENGAAFAGKSFLLLMALPAAWYAAEVLTMLTNKKRRALHDFIAGTVVVRTNALEGGAQQGAPPNAGSVDAPPAPVS